MADNKGVMVLAEVGDGKLATIATELLGAGRKLADDLSEELSAVMIGSGVGNLAQEAIAEAEHRVDGWRYTTHNRAEAPPRQPVPPRHWSG